MKRLFPLALAAVLAALILGGSQMADEGDVLEFDGAHQHFANPALRLATKSVSAAQIANLDPFTENVIVIVPAPGGRKYIWPIATLVHFRPGATPYSQAAGGWYIGAGATATEVLAHSFNVGGDVPFDSATDAYSISPMLVDPVIYDFAAFENQPLALAFSNPPPTDGDGTMSVRVLYTIIDGAP